MLNINKKGYYILILCNYKELSSKVERWLINKFIYKNNVWKSYIIKKLRYKKEMLIIVITF